MNTPQQPDKALLQTWLQGAHLAYYQCNECEGLHLRTLQELEGVIDSRLFLERYGLLLTTELEVRPMALLPIAADLGRLNMDYPTLKIFLDVVDDATPQLVVAGTLPTEPGVTERQFAHFAATTVAATRQLAAECLQLDYLFPEAEAAAPQSKRSLH